MECHACNKKVVPHHVTDSFEVELAKKSVNMSVDDCIRQEFTVHELHCDCFKLFHAKCYPTELLGTICLDCKVRYRADYCYVSGDLEYIKTTNELENNVGAAKTNSSTTYTMLK
jgi:hypothetical protein